MSERVTTADLERLAGSVTETLPVLYAVEVQRRNGYVALDLYRGAACLETLTVGSAREVYTFLQGMRRFALIAGRSA